VAAKILQIAEAVKTALNAQTFGVAFTAVRGYRPVRELEVQAEPEVIVAPGAWSGEAVAEGVGQTEHTIYVRIVKRVADPTDNAQVDPLLTLADDVQQFLLGSYQDETAACTGCSSELDEEELFSPGQFDCLLTATFEVIA
jgi:hypothetical protein